MGVGSIFQYMLSNFFEAFAVLPNKASYGYGENNLCKCHVACSPVILNVVHLEFLVIHRTFLKDKD